MMDFNPIGSSPTYFTFIVSSLQDFFSGYSPSVRISKDWISSCPSWMIFSMQAIFRPPFSRTGMATKEMFGMKIGRGTTKFFSTPIAFFCNLSSSLYKRFIPPEITMAKTRTKLFINRFRCFKFFPTVKASFFNFSVIPPSKREITFYRAIFSFMNFVRIKIKFFSTIFTYCLHSILRIQCFRVVIKLFMNYCEIAKKRLAQQRLEI